MLTGLRSWSVGLAFLMMVALVVGACGGGNNESGFSPDSGATLDGSIPPTDGASSSGGDSGSPVGGDSGSLIGGDGGSSGGKGDSGAAFEVLPSALQTVTVTIGQKIPTVVFQALESGQPVTAGWSVDRGNLATITQGASAKGTFTPTAAGGGLVTVTAGRNGVTVMRQVFIKIVASQNGANPGMPGESTQIAPVDAGAPQGVLTAGGGIGGVGGEGLGAPVTNMPTLNALGSPTNNGQAQGLAWLYPYDATVWPRGLLAPLLQWTWSTGDADAIEIKLQTTSGSFTWSGTFGRPAILALSGGPYIRAPIPQDVWAMATNTAGGPVPGGGVDRLGVSLVVAKGGLGYGPISETWTVAPGILDGIIYYNSYGTQLVQNFSGAVGGNGSFGGAVLSIHVGDTAPKVAAGTDVSNSGCRVCHSVAAQGTRLVVQHGDDRSVSSAYDLPANAPPVEHVMVNDATFPAVYPDGTMALTEDGQLLPLPTDTTPIATTGLSSVVTDLGEPSFSPDGTSIVFDPWAGAASIKVNVSLYVMNFDKATMAFSNPVLVADDTGQPSGTQPGWPAFFPDSKSVVYHHQTVSSLEDELGTRCGAHAQIYWTNFAGASSVTPLDQLNGKGYLPKLPAPNTTLSCSADCYQVAGGTAPQAGCSPYPAGVVPDPNLDHSDDVDMNYEPTVNPVAAGGYAWVVFTSRRMYGNVATIPPYCSDPRGVDLIDNITTKKLWVAAIDLSAKPGVDASHPAFYLPAQELLAGNARAFWVQAPCLSDGASCMTGDQCCNGYCEQGTGDAGLVCGNKPPNATCSQQGDKCTSSADCCLSTDSCINGFCEQSISQ